MVSQKITIYVYSVLLVSAKKTQDKTTSQLLVFQDVGSKGRNQQSLIWDGEHLFTIAMHSTVNKVLTRSKAAIFLFTEIYIEDDQSVSQCLAENRE